tara:strand:+ start:445 stop:558 length:114 start_codon:yes stop_codon:yes gene_type:complete
MDNKMKEMDSKIKKVEEQPSKVEKSVVGDSNENLKFT